MGTSIPLTPAAAAGGRADQGYQTPKGKGPDEPFRIRGQVLPRLPGGPRPVGAIGHGLAGVEGTGGPE